MAGFGSAARAISVPRPQQRPRGTLATSVTPGLNLNLVGDNAAPDFHWAAGVVLVGDSCGLVQVEALNCEMTSFSGDTQYGSTVEFDPIVVWASRVCSLQSGRSDELTPAAARIVDEQVGFALARELYSGSVSGNPAIRKDPTIISGTALTHDELLCSIEEEVVARVGNLQVTIHVPAALLNRLATWYAITPTENRFMTPTGHVVIGDGAYSGAAPIVNGTPQSAPAEGNGWVYVTGPVNWAYGPEMTFDPTDLGDGYHRTNRIRGQAQRLGIAVYDPTCIHLALLAEVC